jgi:hypothetical protein
VGWTIGGGGALVAIGPLCGPGRLGADGPPDWPPTALVGPTAGWMPDDPDGGTPGAVVGAGGTDIGVLIGRVGTAIVGI